MRWLRIVIKRHLCFCFTLLFFSVGCEPVFKKRNIVVILQCFIVFICKLIYLKAEHCTDVFTCRVTCFFFLLYKKMLVTKGDFEDNKKKCHYEVVHYFLRRRGLPEVLSDVNEWFAEVYLELCAAKVVVQFLPPFLWGVLLIVD